MLIYDHRPFIVCNVCSEECMVDSRKTEKILGRTPREFLSVSALKFFLQTNLLAVGFNTSCFQLWDLSTLTLQLVWWWDLSLADVDNYSRAPLLQRCYIQCNECVDTSEVFQVSRTFACLLNNNSLSNPCLV